FLDDARMSGLARDNARSSSTAYAYRDEAIAVLATRQPSLHGALLAAKAAGYSHGNRGRHPALHRPDRHPRPDSRGGSVVEWQTPPSRGQHPGRVRPGRVAAVDLGRAPGPRA